MTTMTLFEKYQHNAQMIDHFFAVAYMTGTEYSWSDTIEKVARRNNLDAELLKSYMKGEICDSELSKKLSA